MTGANNFAHFCLTPWLETLPEVDVDTVDCMGSVGGLFSVCFFGRPGLFFGCVCWLSGTTFISESHGFRMEFLLCKDSTSSCASSWFVATFLPIFS